MPTANLRRRLDLNLFGVFQLGIVVVLAAASALYLGWNAMSHASLDAERQSVLRHARIRGQDLLISVINYALVADESERDRAVTARADLIARLESLAAHWPEHAETIEQAARSAESAGVAADPVWQAETEKARLKAARGFEEQWRQLGRQIAGLDSILIADTEQHIEDFAELCYAVLGFLATVHVLVGIAFLLRERRTKLRWTNALGGLGRHLAHIFDAEGMTSGAPAAVDPLLGTQLATTVADLRSAHHDLVKVERVERQHARFAQELIEALEIDDEPDHVYTTVERAARLRMGDTRFRLLVADSAGTSLEEKVALGQPLCDAPLPNRCPAIRKGRLVQFSEDSGLARCPFLHDDSARAMCAPVAASGRAFAVAQLTWENDRNTSDLGGDLVTLVGTLGTRLGVLRTLEEREIQAATDPLTGLANRRAMGKCLSDLDHFKRLNDDFGHETGDKCLQLFARVLKEESRTGDLACRPGGEEFLQIVRGANAEQAVRVADRIRESLAHLVQLNGPVFTASMGIASCPEHAADHEELLKGVDRLLYQAKEAGRDCYVIAGGAEPSPKTPLPRADVPASVDDEDRKQR